MNAYRSKRHAVASEPDLLPPDRARRLQKPIRATTVDIVDADYVIVRERAVGTQSKSGAASGAWDPLRDRPGFHVALPSGGFREQFMMLAQAQMRRIELALQSLSDRAFARLVATSIVLVLLAFVPAIVIGQSAPIEQAQALDITHVNLTPQDANGMRVLLVNAIIHNRSVDTLSFPRLRADLVADGQVIASTYIEAPVAELNAGHSRGIAARLQHPGGKTPELRLSFETQGASSS